MTASAAASTDRPAFGALHAALRRHVEGDLFAGLSHAVLRGRTVVDRGCVGWADREAGVPLREDHLFRIYSNTKLVTSCTALLLWQEGRFGLDDPVARWLPALANPRVLRPGATRLDDTAPARGPITVRHLLTHTAGFSLGLLDPGTPIFEAYAEHGIRDRTRTAAEMVESLGRLPLLFEPGTAWEYSVATDVLGRLIEVWAGQPLDAVFAERVFGPLGMADTGFVVPPSQAHRLVALYAGADDADPAKPGLTRSEEPPGAFVRPQARLGGGGGLVSSLGDMVTLLRSLLPGGPTLLKPETIALAARNHLPPGVWVQFRRTGVLAGLGHGLLSAVTVEPGAHDPAALPGELRWGGIAGTQWWISPRAGIAAVLMAQRQMAFFHPLATEFKQQVHAAFGIGTS